MAIAAAGGGDHGRAPAAQRGGVEHVVVDERRGVDQLDRDRRAQDPGVVARPAPGGEEDEQRAQALAAGGDRLAGVLGPAARRARRPAPPAAPRARSISPGTCGPPAATTASTLAVVGITRTSPTWIAMIPPAVRIQRTVRSPAASIAAASAPRAGEALHRVGQVGVGVRVRRRPAPGRAPSGRTTARRSVDSGGRVGRGDLEDHDAAAGAHDARHLRRPPLEVGEVARAEADGRGVERVVGVGQRRARCPTRTSPAHARGRRLARAQRRASPRRSPSRPPRPPGPTRRASSIARSPVPVATSSTRLPGPTAARSAARARQRWCRPGGHDRVHPVVDPGDAIEHRAHLRPPPACRSSRRCRWSRPAVRGG